MDKEREAAMLVAANILNGPIDKIDSANLQTILEYGNIQGSFICGVRWADNNPESPWVSIKERMPEDSIPEVSDPEKSRDNIKVMLRLKNDTIMEARRKLYSDRKYYWNIPLRMRDQITHWMPIPPLPSSFTNLKSE